MGCASSVQPQPRPLLTQVSSGIIKPPPIIIPKIRHELEGESEKEAALQRPCPTSEPSFSPALPSTSTQPKHRIFQASYHHTFRPESGKVPAQQQRTEVMSSESFASGLIFADVNHHVAQASALMGSIKKGDLKEVQKLIAEHYNGEIRRIHDLRGMWNSSPLIVAAQYQQKELLSYLLSPPAQPPSAAQVNHANDKGATALHYAAMEGLSEAITQLLNYGAAPHPSPSLSPLYNAASDSSLFCTPLSIAIINERRAVVSQLLNAGGREGVNSPFPFPCLPGGGGSKKGEGKSEEGTGEGNGVRGRGVEGGDGTGLTPLLLAAACGSEPLCRELLHRGADVNFTCREGGNVLHYLARGSARTFSASLQEKIQQTFQLLQAEQKVSFSLLSMKDTAGQAPLSIACEAGGKGAAGLSLLFLAEGASPSLSNPFTGLSPLHVAIKRKNGELLGGLLEYGGDPTRAPSPTPLVPSPLSPYEFALRSLPPGHAIVRQLEREGEVWGKMRAEKGQGGGEKGERKGEKKEEREEQEEAKRERGEESAPSPVSPIVPPLALPLQGEEREGQGEGDGESAGGERGDEVLDFSALPDSPHASPSSLPPGGSRLESLLFSSLPLSLPVQEGGDIAIELSPRPSPREPPAPSSSSSSSATPPASAPSFHAPPVLAPQRPVGGSGKAFRRGSYLRTRNEGTAGEGEKGEGGNGSVGKKEGGRYVAPSPPIYSVPTSTSKGVGGQGKRVDRRDSENAVRIRNNNRSLSSSIPE